MGLSAIVFLVAPKDFEVATKIQVAPAPKLVHLVGMQNQALDRAIEVAGSQVALAKAIGSAQQTISFWKTGANAKVPAEMCIRIEAATKVPREELRPDIFGASVARLRRVRGHQISEQP